MTVTSTNRKAGPFSGNDVTDEFPFAFTMQDADDLVVTTRLVATGVETVLAQGSDYTALLNPDQSQDPGGTVTLTSPLASGYVLVITSSVEPLQKVEVTNQGGFFPAVFNAVFDKLTILVQQVIEQSSRALRLPVTSGAISEIQQIANGILRWSPDASAILAVDVQDIQGEWFYATSYADQFTGNGVQTTFTLTADPQVLSNMDVAVGGVTKYPISDYNLAGGQITFAVAPANAAKILVRYQQTAVLTAGVLSVAGLMGVVTASQLKTNLALDNVENKSSAAIRGELTAGNVTTGLGSAPLLWDREKAVTAAIVGGVLTLDFTDGATRFDVNWNANVTDVQLVGLPDDTDSTSWTLVLTHAAGGPFTFAPGVGFHYINNATPTFSTTPGDRNYMIMTTIDGGDWVDIFPPGFTR